MPSHTRLAAPEQTAAEGKFVITREKFARIEALLEPPGREEGVTIVDTTAGTVGAIDGRPAALRQRLRDRLV